MIKQLELELQERLFIVESENEQYVKSLMFADFEGKELSFICKGNELSEGKLKGLIKKEWNFSRVEVFVAYVFSKGYYWGENPEGRNRPNFNDYSSLIAYSGDCSDWDKAEARTFNPSRTLIFKIS